MLALLVFLWLWLEIAILVGLIIGKKGKENE